MAPVRPRIKTRQEAAISTKRLAIAFWCFALLVTQSSRLNAQEEWTVLPELEITGPDTNSLPPISRIEVDPAGNIYAVARTQLFVFDSAGNHVRTMSDGVDGSTLEPIGAIGWRGDSLYLVRTSDNRVTFFDTAGIAIGVMSVPKWADPPYLTLIVWSLLPDGNVLASAGASMADLAAGRVRDLPYLLLDSLGHVQDTVAWAPLSLDDHIVISSPKSLASFSAPLTTKPILARSMSGFVRVEFAFKRSAGSVQITRTGLDGDTLWIVARPFHLMPVSRQYADSLYRDLAERHSHGSGFGSLPVLEREALIRKAYQVPQYFPPVETAQMDDEGTVWLRRLDDERLAVWDILSAEGEPVATARMAAVSVLKVTSQHVYSVERDGKGQRIIVRYSIRRQAEHLP